MNIGRQWEDRLKIWAEQFDKHTVHRVQPLSLAYFETTAHLSLFAAEQEAFAPAPPGLKWGAKWAYGWFKTAFTVPEALAGERLVLHIGAGEEMLVFVNGEEAGAIDKKHRYITLTRCAKAGERYDILAECYAGHGVRNEGAGPVAPWEVPVPEPPQKQQTVCESFVGVWNESVFQAQMDYLTLYSLVKKLPEKSLRTMKIVHALKEFTRIADFELPREEMTASVEAARRALAPALACQNGSTAPEYTIFGQSHLDLAWLWPVEETTRKCARTYANQLALMEEYEDYRFLLCEPPILETLKAHYPHVWARVQERAAQGAFYPEGALFVESDTNIPCGESLIRQFVLGRRWFKENLGVDSVLAWMPDTFGFCAQLPQIMRKCGVRYFATQKLVRQDPEADPFPYNVFWWEGIDGSRVLSHLFKKNNANFDSGELITRWEEDRIQQEGIDGLLYPFGFGDGGGGPTRQMIEIARRCADLEGAPRCRMENPVRYFERESVQNTENIYRGELYLAWHRGTLTAQTKTKRGIRRAENALRTLHHAFSSRLLKGEALIESWKEKADALENTLLFNTFHDIAPGTSIARVHERAEEELGGVIAGCHALLEEMGRSGLPAHAPVGAAFARETEDGFVLENARLTLRVNRRGEVVSLRRAGETREYMAGAGNRFVMLKDVNTCYDAWEIGSMAESMPVALDDAFSVVVTQDPRGAALRVTGRLHDSQFVQTILLAHDAQRVDFETEIDWQEKHKLLKAAFPLAVLADDAVFETQFGYVKRPTHRSRQHDKDQYEVCNHRYTALCDPAGGAAVLNDGKYGVSVRENEIRLTLLRAPTMPDMHADRGVQTMTYALYPFAGTLEGSDILDEAAALNGEADLSRTTGGEALLLPEEKNIVVSAVRVSETQKNALLVRAYEAMGKPTDTAVTLHEGIVAAHETDMLEAQAKAIECPRRIHFDPFEIKTFLLTLREE
ncbi:MAG: alpha-mannosidase [Clostridia bacterium]|nr:alpha-mannosidase [Clostridia bacterium]